MKSAKELQKEFQEGMSEVKGRIAEMELKIQREVPFIDIKPYSHNIISLCLGAIASIGGNKEANRVIRKYKLKKHGWSEEEEK